MFFIIARNAIVSGFLSRRFAYLAVHAKTSRSYGNDANVLIADNVTAFKVHLVIEFIVLSSVLTVPSLGLSYRRAGAKFTCTFVLRKNFMPRMNGNATSMTTNSIRSTTFSLN